MDYTAGRSSDESTIDDRVQGEDPGGDDSSDWIELARVLDRFFFLVFLLVVVLSGFFSLYKCVYHYHLTKPLGGYGYKIVDDY